MLSCLSRGTGSWSGDFDYDGASTEPICRARKCKSALPRLNRNHDGPHRHGITVTPSVQYRAKTAVGTLRATSPDRQIAIPKTYSTRKGALMLFSSPECDEYDPLKDFPQSYPATKKNKGDNLIDLSLSIGTLERLTLSVLQYGDKSFDPATSSVSDSENKLFLKFLKTLPKKRLEETIQPGGDLSFYLEKLKSTSNLNRFTRLNTPDVAELKSALDALDQSRVCTPVLDSSPTDTGELNQGRLSRPVTAPLLNRRHRSARSGFLSSEKLAASLKSSKFIDRTGPPTPPITLAWAPGADSIHSTDEPSTTVSDIIPTDESIKGTSGRSLANETPAVISHLQGETTLEKSIEINLVENKKSSDSEIVTPDENRSPVPQELSPVLECPEFPESAVFEGPPPQTPPSDHTNEECSTLPNAHPTPSLLEILTTAKQDVEGETVEEVNSTEKVDVFSIASASLPDLDEQDLDLAQETEDVFSSSRQEIKAPNSTPRISSPKSPLDENQDCDLHNSLRERDSPASQTWGAEPIIVPGDSHTSFLDDTTPFLRTSSPIERQVPASSPVDFPQEGFEDNPIQFLEEYDDIVTEDSQMSLYRDNQKLSDIVTVPTSQISADAISVTKMMDGSEENQETQIPEEKNDIINGKLTKSTSIIAYQHSTTAANQMTQEPAVPSSERDGDLPLSGTPMSDLSEVKQELLTTDSRPRLPDHTQQSAHLVDSDLHITSYESGEIPVISKKLKDPFTNLIDTVKGREQVKDSPFTSKSSLRSIRSKSSQPMSPPPPLASLADRFSPSPAPDVPAERIPSLPPPLSPKPPAGAPPTHRSPLIRRGSAKESVAVRRRPPSPETLVRTLSSDGKNSTHSKSQSTLIARSSSATVKKNKRPKTGKQRKQIDEDAERLRLEDKNSSRKKLELEVKVLEEHIRTKEKIRQEQQEQAEKLRREYHFQLDALEKEAAELRQAEEDAKATMAMTRMSQREERELQRIAELERKKQLAINNREREKKMMESGRAKELEMLESIADAEMRYSLVEKMERNRDEEERLALERFEEEMREAELLAEEQEDRVRALERQAEQEAMQRLLSEQDEIEKKRRSLLNEAQKLDEEDEKFKQEIEKEQQKLEEERHQIELEDFARLQLEAARLKEIQDKEAAEKEQMRREIDQKRLILAKQRHKNHDMHKSLQQVRNSQGVTRPYIFSYFVTWPREIYEKPMGGDSKKKRPGPRPKPKSAK